MNEIQAQCSPHPVTVSELEIDGETREQIKSEIDFLLGDTVLGPKKLLRMKLPPSHPSPCRIEEVGFFADGEQRRFLITGEEANLAIETSLATAEVQVYAL